MADEKMVQLLREVGLDASVEEKFKQVWVGQPAPRGTRNGCDCQGQRRSYGVLVLVGALCRGFTPSVAGIVCI